MNRFFILFIVLFISTAMWAKGKTTAEKDSISNVYIQSYSDLLTLYTYGITKSSDFEFIKADRSIEYFPNQNLNLGFGFNYKWLGLSLAFNLGFINNDDDLYGVTTNPLTLQLDIYPKGWLVNVNTQLYQGYYWSNPDDFNDLLIPQWNPKDSLLHRPSMTTFSLGASGIYAFNKTKFSYRAAYANTEQQNKSAGSFLLGAVTSLYVISDTVPIIPSYLNKEYPDASQITGIGSSLIGILAGYTYTVVVKESFYANAALLVGINYQHVSLFDASDNPIDRIHKGSGNAVFRFGMGYSKPRYYFGINASMANYVLRSNTDEEFSHTDSKFRFFYGRRFNVNKKQQKLNEY